MSSELLLYAPIPRSDSGGGAACCRRRRRRRLESPVNPEPRQTSFRCMSVDLFQSRSMSDRQFLLTGRSSGFWGGVSNQKKIQSRRRRRTSCRGRKNSPPPRRLRFVGALSTRQRVGRRMKGTRVNFRRVGGRRYAGAPIAAPPPCGARSVGDGQCRTSAPMANGARAGLAVPRVDLLATILFGMFGDNYMNLLYAALSARIRAACQ